MDERFPKWLRALLRKIDFLGIPNLGLLVPGLAILACFGQFVLHAPMDQFLFDPQLVSQGQWWRLFAYPIPSGMDNPIFLIMYLLYVWFIFQSLEQHWGPAPLTLFIFLSYCAAIGGAFLVNQPLSIWYYVVENTSLAFGTLFPDLELLLFFILPVKAKWLAYLAGALLGWDFVTGSLMKKAFLLIVLSPYFIFFGKLLYKAIKMKRDVAKNRRKMDDWRR